MKVDEEKSVGKRNVVPQNDAVNLMDGEHKKWESLKQNENKKTLIFTIGKRPLKFLEHSA